MIVSTSSNLKWHHLYNPYGYFAYFLSSNRLLLRSFITKTIFLICPLLDRTPASTKPQSNIFKILTCHCFRHKILIVNLWSPFPSLTCKKSAACVTLRYLFRTAISSGLPPQLQSWVLRQIRLSWSCMFVNCMRVLFCLFIF